MLLLGLLWQLQAADSVYATPALRTFISKAAVENRAPPLSLAGYNVTVESELALRLRDSLGREAVGQLEQLAARAEWERNGRYDLYVSTCSISRAEASPPSTASLRLHKRRPW